MVEFGEKMKQLREERGMTQQTVAEKLYVTRQAVSRWECGARYPDLLTAKRIAQILQVSLDELLSGEELKENIEKEPVLAQPVENIVQTVLYTVATVAYLLMCVFSIYSLFPNEALANTPVGKLTLSAIGSISEYFINFGAILVGLLLSVKNKLTHRAVGVIMALPYIAGALHFSVYLEDMIRLNGWIALLEWGAEYVVLPLLFALYIFLFFKLEERRLPYCIIIGICLLSLGYIALGIRQVFIRTTQLGLVVRTVHVLGKTGIVLLLGYQAHVWNQKKKIAYKRLK